MARSRAPIVERIVGSIAFEDRGHVTPCWVWQFRCDRDGYPRINLGQGGEAAYRVSYEAMVGPVPVGLELDHLCRVRQCVNPAHLEPVTHAENVRRGTGATKTHCVNGHAFDEANTRWDLGRRKCRACLAQRARASRGRRKAMQAQGGAS